MRELPKVTGGSLAITSSIQRMEISVEHADEVDTALVVLYHGSLNELNSSNLVAYFKVHKDLYYVSPPFKCVGDLEENLRQRGYNGLVNLHTISVGYGVGNSTDDRILLEGTPVTAHRRLRRPEAREPFCE